MADPDNAVRARATDFILKKWGSLRDLPQPLISVVWVTVYKSMKIVMRVEAEGGPKGLLKNTLIGDRKLSPAFDEAVLWIEFLQKMIPLIRSNASTTEQMADAQLVIDILKWGIEDAASMSGLKRSVLRKFAKTDPEYKKQIPPEIVS